jgi:hypothetical protein
MIMVSPFVIVPGAIIFYVPAGWQLLWPIWFGVPGCIGIFIGDLSGCQFKRLYGLPSIIEAFGNFLSGYIPYLTIPKGVSNLKTSCLVCNFPTREGNWYTYHNLGLRAGYALVYRSLLYLPLTFGLSLLKILTPIPENLGMYYGVRAEKRDRRKVC